MVVAAALPKQVLQVLLAALLLASMLMWRQWWKRRLRLRHAARS